MVKGPLVKGVHTLGLSAVVVLIIITGKLITVGKHRRGGREMRACVFAQSRTKIHIIIDQIHNKSFTIKKTYFIPLYIRLNNFANFCLQSPLFLNFTNCTEIGVGICALNTPLYERKSWRIASSQHLRDVLAPRGFSEWYPHYDRPCCIPDGAIVYVTCFFSQINIISCTDTIPTIYYASQFKSPKAAISRAIQTRWPVLHHAEVYFILHRRLRAAIDAESR